MNKPDTKAIRDYVTKPERYWDEPTVYNAVQVAVLNRHIVNLCDYIDSLPDHCDHEDRVRAEIRKFVAGRKVSGSNAYCDGAVDAHRDILDFIDNGPKKPTAEDVIERYLDDEEITISGGGIADALREAGLLKED